TCTEAAPVKRNQHRAFRPVTHAGRPDIKHKAILAHPAGMLVPLDHHAVFRAQICRRLGANLAVTEAFSRACPGRGLLWRHETIFAAGGRAVRYAFEFLYPGVDDSLHLTAVCFRSVERFVFPASRASGRGGSLRQGLGRQAGADTHGCNRKGYPLKEPPPARPSNSSAKIQTTILKSHLSVISF